MLVPEHAPARYFPAAQLTLVQAAHAVLDVPVHLSRVYLPVPHAAHVAQVPAAVVDAPLRCFPAEQEVWAVHEYPLLVPEHTPVR